jgi:hypothetical protein
MLKMRRNAASVSKLFEMPNSASNCKAALQLCETALR